MQQVRAEGWTPSSKRRSVGPQRGEVDDGRDTWREPGTKGLEGSGNDFLWRLGSREEGKSYDVGCSWRTGFSKLALP